MSSSLHPVSLFATARTLISPNLRGQSRTRAGWATLSEQFDSNVVSGIIAKQSTHGNFERRCVTLRPPRASLKPGPRLGRGEEETVSSPR